MSCKMKIEQLKEAICNGNEEVKSGQCLENVALNDHFCLVVILFYFAFISKSADMISSLCLVSF